MSHKKGYDNMIYQRKSRKDITQEQKDPFDATMKNDGEAGKAVLELSRDIPPELLGASNRLETGPASATSRFFGGRNR